MAVADLSKHGELSESLDGELPEFCFYCGQPLPSGPTVLWHGTRTIALHWICAVNFAAHLGHDAIHAKTIEKDPHRFPAGIDASVKP